MAGRLAREWMRYIQSNVSQTLKGNIPSMEELSENLTTLTDWYGYSSLLLCVEPETLDVTGSKNLKRFYASHVNLFRDLAYGVHMGENQTLGQWITEGKRSTNKLTDRQCGILQAVFCVCSVISRKLISYYPFCEQREELNTLLDLGEAVDKLSIR